MTNYDIRGLDRLLRILSFWAEHPEVAALPAAAAGLAQIQVVAAALRESAGGQVHRHTAFQGAAGVRFDLANRMRKVIRALRRSAKELAQEGHPELFYQFNVPKSRGYDALLAAARVAVEAAKPLRGEFGTLAADAYIDELEQLLAEFKTATDAKMDHLLNRVIRTAELRVKSRQGGAIARRLDVILSNQFRNDPVLLRAWKTVARIHRAGSSTGISTLQTTATASAEGTHEEATASAVGSTAPAVGVTGPAVLPAPLPRAERGRNRRPGVEE